MVADLFGPVNAGITKFAAECVIKDVAVVLDGSDDVANITQSVSRNAINYSIADRPVELGAIDVQL